MHAHACDRPRAPRWRALAAAALATCTAGTARADEPSADRRAPRAEHVFVADPDFTMEGNVRTFESFGRVLFLYEKALPTWSDNAVALAAGRTAKLLFLDAPLAYLTAVTIHEVAGHGARGRELGRSPVFSFKLPEPYRSLLSPGDDEANLARSRDGIRGQPDKDVLFVMGGTEANHVTCQWLNRRLVAMGGRAHHADLLVYGVSRVAYASSFLGSDIESGSAGGSDDVAAYVDALQARFDAGGADDRRRVASRLRAGYIWNLFDPTLALSVWGTLVDALGRGRAYSELPLPQLGGLVVYPAPRFGLTPFGGEQAIDVRFAPARDRDGRGPGRAFATWVGEVYGRVGTSGLARYQGAGAKLLDVRVAEPVRAGAELDVWNQPVVDLEARSWFDRPNRLGANVGAFGRLALFDRVGVTAKLGYKSWGHVQGLPIAAGLHGYIGLSLDPR